MCSSDLVLQGAQVIGQALPNISSGVKNKIVFNMLFSDPKLYLPEGEGIFPPACRNEKLSALSMFHFGKPPMVFDGKYAYQQDRGR